MPRALISQGEKDFIVHLRDNELLSWDRIAYIVKWSAMGVWKCYHRHKPRDYKHKGTHRKILPGEKFGLLTVLSTYSRRESVPSGSRWYIYCRCICKCGNKHTVRAQCLRDKTSRSCGCLKASWNRKNKPRKSHGMSKSSEWNIWNGMRYRCLKPNNPEWKWYGGRGITVCKEWLGRDGFAKFFAHVGPRPSMEHSLDRINPDKNYEPDNVRWGTKLMQRMNQSRVIEACFEEESPDSEAHLHPVYADDSV